MEQQKLKDMQDQSALGMLRLRRSAERLLAAAEADGRKRDASKMATQLRQVEKLIAQYGIEAYAAKHGLELEPFDEREIELARSGLVR
jgi:ABC-type lipopolysaccharide export system ATPase subunit